MQISERLMKIASMVSAGNRLADVGTDHGYVPIYLYERGVIPHAIAMDINKGPLERADLHIREKGLDGAIETRLSDGLKKLLPGEADTILIAGMGGPLMVRILSACPDTTASAKELVLQPQSEIGDVRKWLYENGREIVEEHFVFEEGKYYPMFRAVKNPQAKKPDRLEYRFGSLAVQHDQEVLKSYLRSGITKCGQIIAKLSSENTQKAAERLEELLMEKAELTEMLSRIPELL